MKVEPIFLVDQDSPFAELLFSGLGRVEYFGDSDPTSRPDLLESADVLSVRSSTRVDSGLLSRCNNLKVIVTPVVGTDHIDTNAVAELSARLGRVIPVFNAAGSTAEAVADWTIGAIFKSLEGAPTSVGVVGVGNIGRQVARRLDLLGITYLTCDPGRMDEPEFRHTPIEEVLGCQVVTFHVPMTRSGQSPWPTAGMISGQLCEDARHCGCRLFVNSSRGGIVVPDVFLMAGDRRPALACDVFLDEPAPAPAAIAACTVATPHLAGSGRYGRARAAMMVRDKVRAALDLPSQPLDPGLFGLPGRPEIRGLPGCISTESGMTRFLGEIDILSGTSQSASFRSEYISAAASDRARVFTSFRMAGTRTEPLWIGSCN
ncbi:MAG TPA: NAD(P)-dependent oxidoreductase [Myxococcota bacterium]|nr:NAD(P)-dependent oxidoreductase [Myxococcota bacterium]